MFTMPPNACGAAPHMPKAIAIPLRHTATVKKARPMVSFLINLIKLRGPFLKCTSEMLGCLIQRARDVQETPELKPTPTASGMGMQYESGDEGG